MEKKENNSIVRKKKKNNAFLKFFVVIELIALIVAILSSLILSDSVTTRARYNSEYQDKISYYEESNFEYIASGASFDQINDFDSKAFVKNVTSASVKNMNVKTNNVEDLRSIIIFDDESELTFTEFTTDRIISSIESTDNNYIYCDYKFTQLYDVELGDSVSVASSEGDISLKITKVFKTDYKYSEGILISTSGVFEKNSSIYSLYLNSNNREELDQYLQSYKPLGTLLAKTNSQTEEDYQTYLDEFNSKNYYDSYITNLSTESESVKDAYTSKIAAANNTYYISIGIVSIVCCITSLACFLVNAKNKKDRLYKYIQENGNKKISLIFTIFNASFMVFYLISALVTTYICSMNLTVYYPIATMFATNIPMMLIPIILIAISYLITILKIKKA